MKKITSKVLAFILVLVCMMQAMPEFLVYASTQNPLTGLALTLASNVLLSWDAATTTAVVNGGVDADSPPVIKYTISLRNTSRNESYKAPAIGSPTITDTKFEVKDSLVEGSLYQFRVKPSHTHITTGSNGVTGTADVTSTDSGTAPNEEILFLTDIKVEAQGSPDYMTVTWDNPNFQGKDLFTKYRIYVNLPSPVNNDFVEVSSDSADLIHIGNKLEYTFKTSKPLDIATKYIVGVEPMITDYYDQTKSVLARDKSGGVKVTAPDGKTYSLYFYPKGTHPYQVTGVSIKLTLQAEAESSNTARLYWNSLKNANPRRVEVYRSKESTGTGDEQNLVSPTLLGELLGDGAMDTNYWLTDHGGEAYYYQLYVYYQDAQGNEISPPMKSTVKYYDPAIVDFLPYRPNIATVTDSQATPYSMDIYWDAFVRKPYNAAEKLSLAPGETRYVDKNVAYKVYITDDYDLLNNPNLPALKSDNIFYPKASYTTTTKTFYQMQDGQLVEKDLQGNKIYYIKVVAFRLNPTGDDYQSLPAYKAYYLYPVGDIKDRPNMLASPPLKIKEVDNVPEITIDSITIEWNTKWVELYDEDTNSWYSEVGIDASGRLIFNKDQVKSLAKAKRVPLIYNNPSDAIAAIVAAGATVNVEGLYPTRVLDLADAKYDLHVVEYDTYQALVGSQTDATAGYDAYIKRITDDASWQLNIPAVKGDTADKLEYVVKNSNSPAGKLVANKSYVMFLRPFYGAASDKKIAYLPAYVMGTTLLARPPVDITPGTPILILVEEKTTDVSLSVKWKYLEGLKYEISYSDLLGDYPAGGTKVDAAKLNALAGDAEGYMNFTIDNLFPDTTYHIWIRAVADNSTGVVNSSWSNPVSGTTKDIAAPDPPDGLGLISGEHLLVINKGTGAGVGTGTDYKQTDKDYMIIEWLRDALDVAAAGTGTATDAAGTAGSATSVGSVEALTSPDLLLTYIAKFNQLTANKDYYVRAKTVLTITRGSGGTAGAGAASGKVTRSYSYVVQLSASPQFTDVMEITIPPLKQAPALSRDFKQKESVWSTTRRFVTGKTTDEYDGDQDALTHPLPQQNFEILYDRNTQTLTYRFRTNKVDANGNKDNSVDQRFISELIKNKNYSYEIDLSKYNNNNVNNRVIELPYSIFKAFGERKIDLKVRADNLAVTLTADSLNTADVKNLKDFGKDAMIKISLQQNPSGIPLLKSEDGRNIEEYASDPHKLSVQVITGSRTIALNNLAKPIKVDLKLKNRNTTLDKNVGAYLNDLNIPDWQRTVSTYDNPTGVLSFTTAKAASYAAIAKDLPMVTMADANNSSIQNVATKVNITDLREFNPKSNINAIQFNNAVAAVAKGRRDFNINDTLSDADNSSLTKAKVLVNGTTVSREYGINALVKLYEIKTKATIKNYSKLSESPYRDIANAQKEYQAALLKAGDLGFFSNNPNANPKAYLTIGDFFYMLDIIMEDSGM